MSNHPLDPQKRTELFVEECRRQGLKLTHQRLEDIVNTGQRTKAEEFDDYIYVVLKMLDIDTAVDHITAEQVSLILGPHFLISFQEKEGDVFINVRERIRKARGRIRKFGCDYLAYALMDAVVDHYFVILEKLGEKIEQLEKQLLENPTPGILEDIHHLKREMIFFRKQIWPLREVINSLIKDPSELIQETTHIFLRDVYDHTIQVIDTIESFRDVLSGLSDLYLSTVSNRMNEVMKVLTIIATIFIPLTFIAGIGICAHAARRLGVHDHQGIVWDEIVGYLVTMTAAPGGWEWLAGGFILFRLFDIAKPWPIRWLDRQVHGGLGIMLDDLLAGVFAAAILQGIVYFL